VENGNAEVLINKDKSTSETIKSLASLSTAIQFILQYPLNKIDIVKNPYLQILDDDKHLGILGKLKKWFS
jgi:hypothetical protein